MADLFKKLNVLIKATLNDMVTDLADSALPRRETGAADAPRSTQRPRLGADIDRELAALRQRVNEAIAYENRLQAREQALAEQAAVLDAAVNDALNTGREDAAQQQQTELLRARRGLQQAQADLHEHQRVTQELIERVNLLDTYVAEAKRRQQEQIDALDTPSPSRPPLADALRSVRESTSDAASSTAPRSDDLDQRRQRLSRPPQDPQSS